MLSLSSEMELSASVQFMCSQNCGCWLSKMATKYILSALAGSFAVAYICDVAIADHKIFGGTTPSTVSNKDWWEETDKKFQAWPRTAGPPVVMNPISRQNFIVKNRID
ncbi:hypothetical protein M9H77_04118 [Catharanthus roseus]|uniref:Uncharacterized protein n=1 Tax=Catharanthus roseus TaxID=4058 RepID=A0ACC0CDD0_CATRO|nr:hypothetical protein M9H77_04118 [Catharanthus roseus]